MGERLANNAELVFQDCFIPDENVVGEVHKGFQTLSEFFPQSNAYAGASVLGVAEACYSKAEEWAKIRVQGGKPLIEHDGIRAQLAEMRMLIDASRSYIHRACYLADNQDQGWDKTLGALPKPWPLRQHGKLLPGHWKYMGPRIHERVWGRKTSQGCRMFPSLRWGQQNIIPQSRKFHVRRTRLQ